MTAEPQDVAYRARALAQAHPLTPLAKEYLDRAVAQQRTSQPVPEIGVWAGAALLAGYCVRRVEEEDAGLTLAPEPDAAPGLDELEELASQVAAEVRTDEAGKHLLGDADQTVETLDRIVASEVSRRVDHWRDQLDPTATAELEEYITWWVVKGYALRIAESASGAIA